MHPHIMHAFILLAQWDLISDNVLLGCKSLSYHVNMLIRGQLVGFFRILVMDNK
jgi:hypothetical protein